MRHVVHFFIESKEAVGAPTIGVRHHQRCDASGVRPEAQSNQVQHGFDLPWQSRFDLECVHLILHTGGPRRPALSEGFKLFFYITYRFEVTLQDLLVLQTRSSH